MSHRSLASLLPLSILIVVAVLAASGVTPAHGASFTVNATHDAIDAAPGDGVCADATSACTLRAVVMETNALPGADEISLPAGTYDLSIAGAEEDGAATGDLDITGELTIRGAGRDPTVIDGGGLDRVIHILSDASLAVSAVTVQNGSAHPGAGLSNEGTLSLTASIVRSNFAVDGGGCSGSCPSPSGGGISNLGGAQIAESLLIDNHASVGGGIVNFSSGSLSIARSEIQVNTADSEGGAVSNFGTLQITGSSLTHNLADSTGGAIDNSGELTLSSSILDDNRSDYGGGLYNQRLSLLTNVTISGSLARVAGGGIVNLGANNSITAVNVTIANNAAPNGGGLYNGSVDGSGEAGLVSLGNTIVALNANGNACSGPTTSLGHNLDSDGTCALTGPGDISNADPKLGPLADNGGPTQTHALLAGSPAIDAGDNTACPATDQRGVARPTDRTGDGIAACDIGAFEAQAVGLVTIVKDAVPDSADLFGFAATEVPCPPFPCQGITFNLSGIDAQDRSTSFTIPRAPGPVEVQESSMPAGWTLSAIACDDGSRVDLASRTAFIDVAPTENVRCVFTNTREAVGPVTLPNTGGGDGPNDSRRLVFAIVLPVAIAALAVTRRVFTQR